MDSQITFNLPATAINDNKSNTNRLRHGFL